MTRLVGISDTAAPPAWVRWLRLAWLVFCAAALGLFLVAVPLRVRQLDVGYTGFTWRAELTGLRVVQVALGQPAWQAGLRPGDLIVTVDAQPLTAGIPAGVSMRRPAGAEMRLKVQSANGAARAVVVVFAPVTSLPFGLPPAVFAWAAAGVDVLYALANCVLAGLVVFRARDHGFALLLGFTLILITLRLPAEYPLLLGSRADWAPGQLWLSVSGYLWIPLVLALFPNGRWHPRWIWLYVLATTAFGIWAIVALSSGVPRLQSLWLDVVLIGVGIWAQVDRYRRTPSANERQQTKWVLFGIAVGYVGFYLVSALYTYLPSLAVWPQIIADPAALYLYQFFGELQYVVLLAIPLSLAFSILRFRLWDIDLLIRRTLLYSLLSGALAAAYLASVLVLQTLSGRLAGGQSPLAVVASTLLIAVLFNPLRRRLQAFIDRRFDRQRYDAAQTLAAFGETLREETDLGTLSERLVDVVDDSMRPERVWLWMRPGEDREPARERAEAQ